MPNPSGASGRYMAGLDGLRALAVIAVIVYHLDPGRVPGGLLGVSVFFVLSGYLITNLLAGEWRRNGRIELKPFLIRRARRLLPAMFVMLAVVAAWIALFDRSRLPAMQGDLAAAVLYVSNWWLVFRQVSYFESFGPLSPLGHLWSLAVEEQFYLLWPFLVALGFRYAPRRGQLTGLIAAGAAVSALAMALIYEPGTDPSRVYYGTDTRAFGLLIGAALAIVWPSGKLPMSLSARSRAALDSVGGAALLVVLGMIVWTNEYDAFLYRGGMVVLSIAAALVVAALAHPASRLGGLMGWKPLRWVGIRSYGIYLWHYPVIVLTKPAVQTGGADPVLIIVQIATSVGLAAFSWRFIEQPIRHGAVRKLWMKWRNRKWTGRRTPGPQLAAMASMLLAVIILGGAGAVKVLPGEAYVSAPVAATTPPFPQQKPDSETTSEPGEPEPTGHVTEPPLPLHPSPPAAGHNPAGPPPQAASDRGKGVTVIGDSVILDAEPYLQKLLPGIVVDGKVGRQLTQAADVVEELKSKNGLGSRVIIELGTNGTFPKKKLESLLGSLGDVHQIVLVNTRVPRPWQDEVNSTLEEVAESFPNTTLVDWYAASEDKNNLFAADGVHLNTEGAEYYASLVAKAIGS
ncbi:acetyltransferase [Paenibacillus mesophilus]|uniref:acyltransferase family protein n=1 Tax=Paenibacillus mesophilus TaxID=2582849 RepID=UPI00110E5A4D|nr:acyltransferase family protein [Paenibacillus mesophilus]TMV48079.1 acetyltransferase [Paenibacillus mesophilus]